MTRTEDKGVSADGEESMQLRHRRAQSLGIRERKKNEERKGTVTEIEENPKM